MARVDIVHDEGMLRIATFKNVQINVWTDAPDVPQMRAAMRVAVSFLQGQPRGTALLNAMVRGTPRFSEGVRDEAVRAMKLKGPFRLGAAHLIAVGGLSGTATRAFVSTALLLARPKIPIKVFAEAKEACDWIAARVTSARDVSSPDDVLAAYQSALDRTSAGR